MNLERPMDQLYHPQGRQGTGSLLGHLGLQTAGSHYVSQLPTCLLGRFDLQRPTQPTALCSKALLPIW
jgi:hypothetical protein